MVVQLVVHLLFFGVMLNRKSFSSAFIIQKTVSVQFISFD